MNEQIKTKIKEVNDYFVNKLINSEFEILKKEINYLLSVDGYTFDFGVLEDYKKVYNGEFNTFMQLKYNQKQSNKIFRNIIEMYKNSDSANELKQAKIKDLEQQLKALQDEV